MQSAVEVGQQTETKLVTAEQLREMTISKEALFERQKANVLDALMSSMVRQATENGVNSYVASLNPQFDPKLLGSITDELSKLGYNVTTESKNDSKIGPFVSMNIGW